MSANVELRLGGTGRRHHSGSCWRFAGGDQRRRMEWRHRPVGDQLGGNMEVGVDCDDEHALSSSWSRKPPPFRGRCRWRTNTPIPGPGPRGPFRRRRRTRGGSSRGFAPMKRGEHLRFAGGQRHVVRTVGRSPAKPNSVCGQHVERRVDVGRRGRNGWWSSRPCGYHSPSLQQPLRRRRR